MRSFIKSISLCIIIVLSLLILFSCKNGVKHDNSIDTMGHFEKRDGIETYIENGEVVKNALVKENDNLYYVDSDGHKVKDLWQIITNDGDYGYFGSFGDLVKDKVREIDGKLYYFDKNGILYRDRTNKKVIKIDDVEYIANGNGELRFADGTIVAETTKKNVVSETKKYVAITETTSNVAYNNVTQTVAPNINTQNAIISSEPPIYNNNVNSNANSTSSGATNANSKVNSNNSQILNVGPGETIASSNENENEIGPGVGLVSNNSVSNQTNIKPGSEKTGETQNQTSNATIRIVSTEEITDSVEDDENECEIVLLKPIVEGKDDDESESINSCIDELVDAWYADVESIATNYSKLPKSIKFTNATISSSTKAKIVITISGKIKTRSGTEKSIQYRISYNRSEGTGEIKKVSNG